MCFYGGSNAWPGHLWILYSCHFWMFFDCSHFSWFWKMLSSSLAEDRVRRSPDPEIPKIRMNLLRSPGFHPWTQDRQDTLRSKKTYIQFGTAPARPTSQDHQGTLIPWLWDLAGRLAAKTTNIKISMVPWPGMVWTVVSAWAAGRLLMGLEATSINSMSVWKKSCDTSSEKRGRAHLLWAAPKEFWGQVQSVR